jgi:nucleolar complex protein 3
MISKIMPVDATATLPARKRRRLSPPEVDHAQSTETSNAPAVSDFVTNISRWNLEQDYETRPWKTKKKGKESTRLPIKTADGRLEQLEVVEVKEEDADSWPESEDGIPPTAEEPLEIKPAISSRQEIIEAKEELARIAGLINEDPEEHGGAFKTLARIAESSNLTVKKLALATQLTVFKDVIPGYRIRPLKDSDMAEKASKEVRQLRAFEQTLVGSYQAYLRELAKNAKLSRGDVPEESASLGSVAISCASALLLAVPHFNFRGDLIKILVDKLSGKRIDADFSKCRETFENLFEADEDGTASLDAMTMLTRMMKARNYRIDESVLNTFLRLRLLSEFSLKGSQNHIDKPAYDDALKGKKPKIKRVFRTKQQRKELKERKAIEKEFKEADAIVGHEERDRMQAETLKLVFVTYVRILKARSAPLMGAVLEGLAKYAHLINQDFFGDLLETLRELTTKAFPSCTLSDSDSDADSAAETPIALRDAARSSLLCTITAFVLLEGQDASKAASTLQLDLSFFTTHLYRLLPALAINPDIELSAKSLRLADPHVVQPATLPSSSNNKVNVQTMSTILLRCLASTLTPRTAPPVRLAAFAHRLMAAALHLPEKSALSVLGLMTAVGKTNGRKIAGLWNTEERRGDGTFEAEAEGLEGCNPFAGSIWEGELLRLHYAAGVRDGVGALEKAIMGARG